MIRVGRLAPRAGMKLRIPRINVSLFGLIAAIDVQAYDGIELGRFSGPTL
jgi:hypothetical protein